MRARTVLIATAVTGLAIAAGTQAATAGSDSDTLRLHETFTKTFEQDLGKPGPTLGDTFSFLSKLQGAHGKSLGNTGGECTLLFKTSYHCTQTYRFGGGDVFAAGYYDTARKDIHWSILGGTGKYRAATGQVDYLTRADGSFDDTFRFSS